MNIIARIRNWWDHITYVQRFVEAELHYKRLGSSVPRADAMREMQIMARIEKFRTWASEEYLKDQTNSLSSLKITWLENNIKPEFLLFGPNSDAKHIFDAISNMPLTEMFHGEAHKKYIASLRQLGNQSLDDILGRMRQEMLTR